MIELEPLLQEITGLADHQWPRPVTIVTTGVFSNAGKTTSSVRFDEVELNVATLERAAFEMNRLPA